MTPLPEKDDTEVSHASSKIHFIARPGLVLIVSRLTFRIFVPWIPLVYRSDSFTGTARWSAPLLQVMSVSAQAGYHWLYLSSRLSGEMYHNHQDSFLI